MKHVFSDGALTLVCLESGEASPSDGFFFQSPLSDNRFRNERGIISYRF